MPIRSQAQTNTLYTQAIFDLTFFTRTNNLFASLSGNYAIGLNCLSGPKQEEYIIDKILLLKKIRH
jgi:hypothetical protein